MNLVNISQLAGVPIFWFKYGAVDVHKIDASFKPVLERAMADLFARWPHGRPEGVLSGGAYVAKAGRHGQGTAFDRSGFQFRGGRQWSLWRERLRDVKLTLGTGALLRKHFPQVLGPWYDADHQDHWHVDDRHEAAGYQASSYADTSFATNARRYMSGLPSPSDWPAFLSAVEEGAGFKAQSTLPIGLIAAGVAIYFLM